ncbi:glycosyltransferase family 59 protein [Babjeviella inositovora NRRL Y-12698]|uniref:Dol-P-Glc:Glc(2)Man(9)GlcNAc(2)-PP-Dol alpha-1,2-glucosyltransferase n=1 Tax=Babjeviella inositovora NRRL Y-12698 TaxID=984486 RepID=A0A1E3QS97_9ASCO|nr:glycosyltransferase family 59 protein [Babjeviella inositovora NRRL Y-12698]ODQ79902.1 glycosyltransferase family 59 protein [Babjeviella inositovora NRRL Y-12698]
MEYLSTVFFIMSLLNWGLAYPVFLTFCCISFRAISDRVTEPFIDEIFHLRQCQQYCGGDFYTWDPKITTPPGLYYLGYAWAYGLDRLGLVDACGISALRSLNLMGGVVCLQLLFSFTQKHSHGVWSTNLTAFPLLVVYYFIFYTDIWSTVLILTSLVLVVALPLGLHPSAYLSAFIGLISISFRQTNIVWLGFNMVVLLDRRVQAAGKYRGNLLQFVMAFVQQMISDWTLVLPYAIDGGLFGAFLLANGSITFGDKENHVAGVHIAQVFYCLTFMAAFSVPIWISDAFLKSYLRFSVGSIKSALVTAMLILTILGCIDRFTVAHPFLLADNRHYVFYIWQRIIAYNSYSRYLLAPIYHFCCFVVGNLLYTNLFDVKPSQVKKSSPPMKLSPIGAIAYLACIAVTIIPSPLFEPRYYILPFLYWRLFVQPSSQPFIMLLAGYGQPPTQRLALEFVMNLAINAVVVFVFVNFEFEWPNEPGVVQRIIW